jgi:alpha-tubulin suppressor-like RCC1 family protein
MPSECLFTRRTILALVFLTGATSLTAQTPPGVTAIAAGSGHSLALASDGTVWEWGASLRMPWDWDIPGDATGHAAPTRVSRLSAVVAVSTGFDHNLAVNRDGTVWAWGFNDGGQLGDGTTTVNRLRYR